MVTFDEIPFEVFITAILPCLTAVDVGRLAQVNQMWKDFSDNPVVWKHLYLQITPGKILDTSLHIGPKSARTRDYNQEYKVFRTTGKVTIIYSGGYPFVPYTTNRCKGSKWFLHHSWCCDCMPKDLKDTLKTWQEIRTDGINSDDFSRSQVPDMRNTYNTAEYCNYVNEEWAKYNRQRGLSTVNLCQNPDHYAIDTLGIFEDCKKKKSFKKATLKILEKAPKAELAKATREKKAKLKKLEKVRAVMQQLELQYLEAEEKEIRAKKTMESFQTGISLA